MQHFQGIWVAMVTPFHHGHIDLRAAQRLAQHLQNQGAAGLVICGTTGEAPTLSQSEQQLLLSAVLEAVGPHFPVIFGISGNSTAEVVAQVQAFNHHALAGLLLTVPYYNRPSQEGIRLHFEAAAAATDHRLVIYNIPYRTGINLNASTAQALSRNPQFAAIKESSGGNLEQLNDLIHHTPLAVLCGDDDLIFTAACHGARGAISAAAHIRPDLFTRMLHLINSGDLNAARALAERLRPLVKALFAEPNPCVIKAALALQGHLHDELRLPMTRASAAARAPLAKILEDVMAL